ncbi:Exocyst complex component EXO70B1 [Glycine soja]
MEMVNQTQNKLTTVLNEVALDNSPDSQRLLSDNTSFEILPHLLHRRAWFLSAAAAVQTRAIRISELEFFRKFNRDRRIQRPRRQHQQSQTCHRRTQNQKRVLPQISIALSLASRVAGRFPGFGSDPNPFVRVRGAHYAPPPTNMAIIKAQRGENNITVNVTSSSSSIMENHDNNLAENENSGTNETEETLPSSSSSITDHEEADPKPDDDVAAATTAEAEPPSPKKDDEEAEEEKKEETAASPASPPPSLENVSEEIDQFLVTLKQKNDENAAEKMNFEIPGFFERYSDLVEKKIAKYDAKGKAKWGEVAEEDSWLLETANRISKLIMLMKDHHHVEPEEKEIDGGNGNGKDSLVNRVTSIHQRVMSYLEEDFRFLMEECRIPTELDPGGNNNNNNDTKGKQQQQVPSSEQEEVKDQEGEIDESFPGYSDETIASLSKIAGEMISGGYESECCQVYIISRRNAFEEVHKKLGLERISIDDMVLKVQWETLAGNMIPAWINTLKQCAAVYFPGERKLAEAVFASSPSVATGLFGSLSRGVVIQLLNFAEGAAMTKRAAEKLFKLLDMYETLREIIPKVNGLFPEESVEELKTEMNIAKSRLGEAAISIFCDLENQIKQETARTAVPGGAVHPLTRYIMNYLSVAGDYKETLEQVFKDHSKIERADSTSRPHNENDGVPEKQASSPFAAQVLRVMDLLDSSLEGKARLYKDVAQNNFFMMNNGRYILQKIKGSSEMSQVMGDTWIRKKSSELRTYHKNYQRETWNRVLACLNPEGLNVNGKVQKPVLKERFKSFNSLFDEIHRTQSSWVVKDEQLQSELRVSISGVVVPAYRAFIGRFAQIFDPGRQTEKYIKYQPEDIETYIDELFDGKPHQSIARRRT